jgi:hypothetical protein
VAWLEKREAQDGSINWFVYWRESGRGSAKRCVKAGTRKRDARRMAVEIQARVNAGLVGCGVIARRVTFGEFADKWLAMRMVRPTTLRRDKGLITTYLLPAFANKQLNSIAVEDIRVLLARVARAQSESTSRRLLAVLGKMFVDAVKNDSIRQNPVEKLDTRDKPHCRTTARTINLDELVAVIGILQEKWANLSIVAALTGLRWGEIASLEEPEPTPSDDQTQEVPAVEALDDAHPSSPGSHPSQASVPSASQGVRSDEPSPSGLRETVSPVPASAVQGPDTSALADMTGLFRAIVHGKITVPECEQGASAGWRLALPEGPFVLVRHSFAVAYGERRRTKPQDILGRWRQAGLIAPLRVDVTLERGPLEVLAFTPLAVSRFIPAIRDEIATWPRLSRGQIRGLNDPTAESVTDAKPSIPVSPRSVPSQRSLQTSAPLRNRPDEALGAVVAWIQINRAELRAPGGSDLGQWEATSHGAPVLLVRTNQAMRILFSDHFDARAVLTAWRDRGTIVARPNRFTVYMRAENGEQANRRTRMTFMAFPWAALERAGLQRDESNSQ